VLAAVPRRAPGLPALAAAGLGAVFRAAPRFGPSALLLVAAAPVAEARRPFRDVAALEVCRAEAPAVRARDEGLAVAFGALARPLPAVPWPPPLVAATAAPRRFGTALARLEVAVLGAFRAEAPATRGRDMAGLAIAFEVLARLLPAVPWPAFPLVAAATAAPRRFGEALALLAPLAWVSAIRARPVAGLVAFRLRDGASADAPAPRPVPEAARFIVFFFSSAGIFAMGSPRSIVDAVPNCLGRLRSAAEPTHSTPGPCCSDHNAAMTPMSHPSSALNRTRALGDSALTRRGNNP
jgi:hypothetical protein